jgi:hypothetical protein
MLLVEINSSLHTARGNQFHATAAANRCRNPREPFLKHKFLLSLIPLGEDLLNPNLPNQPARQ